MVIETSGRKTRTVRDRPGSEKIYMVEYCEFLKMACFGVVSKLAMKLPNDNSNDWESQNCYSVLFFCYPIFNFVYTLAMTLNVIFDLLLISVKLRDKIITSELCVSETNSVWTCFAMFCLASFASAWSEVLSFISIHPWRKDLKDFIQRWPN